MTDPSVLVKKPQTKIIYPVLLCTGKPAVDVDFCSMAVLNNSTHKEVEQHNLLFKTWTRLVSYTNGRQVPIFPTELQNENASASTRRW